VGVTQFRQASKPVNQIPNPKTVALHNQRVDKGNGIAMSFRNHCAGISLHFLWERLKNDALRKSVLLPGTDVHNSGQA
jgi:hypothetical protein